MPCFGMWRCINVSLFERNAVQVQHRFISSFRGLDGSVGEKDDVVLY